MESEENPSCYWRCQHDGEKVSATQRFKTESGAEITTCEECAPLTMTFNQHLGPIAP